MGDWCDNVEKSRAKAREQETKKEKHRGGVDGRTGGHGEGRSTAGDGSTGAQEHGGRWEHGNADWETGARWNEGRG